MGKEVFESVENEPKLYTCNRFTRVLRSVVNTTILALKPLNPPLDLFPLAIGATNVTSHDVKTHSNAPIGPLSRPHTLFSVLFLFQFMRDKSEEFISQQINAKGSRCGPTGSISTPESGRRRKRSVGTPGRMISSQINPCLCYGSPSAKETMRWCC